MRKHTILIFLTLTLLSCSNKSVKTENISTPVYGYKIINTYPHSTSAYTQGLIWQDSVLIEGTGIYMNSKLKRVNLNSGVASQEISLKSQYFGEGITQIDNKIYQLTWRENTMFIYDSKTFEKISEHKYQGEGWGLTTDDTYIYMSSGNNIIQVLDATTLELVRQIEVTNQGNKVQYLNELEWIEGEIWANIYTTDLIVRIDPCSGNVNSIINFQGLLPDKEKTPNTDVLNGIAYDKENKRIFVTGKNWSKLFEIEITNNAND
ncbi:MAG: glutaminyl-peptide cyclotransferase [Rikenellaceae bacterium]